MKKERQSIFILLIFSLTFSALVIHYNFQKVEINNDSSDAFNVDEGLTKPLIVSGAAHRLNAFDLDTMTITTLQRSHVRHGHAFSSPEEILASSPFDTQLYIDGVEVDLYLSTEIDDSGKDPIYYYWYYYSFDAGYFTSGIYEFKVVWTDISGIIKEITNPMTVLEEAHRLNAADLDTMTITTLQRSWIRSGYAFEGPEEILEWAPFDTQLYIDGVEVDLYQYTEIDDSGVDPIYYYWFYYNFDANYFAPGIYEWKVNWTWSSGTYEIISPLTVLEEAHRLIPTLPETMTITTLQRSYVRHGHYFTTPEEILAYSPFDTQLYIDGVEVDLYQYTEIDDSGVDPIYYYWYYYNFDAGYFTPGIHEYYIVWTDSIDTSEITIPLTVLEEAP